ncbi:hypothetical protein [Nocardia carnea]|uniref:hypothetical protein n=1 Tax=Nocardia carnea TaxID=37328 RepID=UPI00245738A5|nr:hypothetical protein [Nocardia carnea]
MLSSIGAALGLSATTGMWPVIVFFGVIALVTMVALCRAKREDIPRVFESFAAAFGFHKVGDSGDAGNTPKLDSRERPPLKQASDPDRTEEVA